MDVRAIVDCKTSLGEGPVWDVQDQKIYWIDSLGNKVFRANQNGSGLQVWDVPAKLDRLPSGAAVARSSRCGAVFMLSASKRENAHCC
jgi:sugar lactone lactonase YvrE